MKLCLLILRDVETTWYNEYSLSDSVRIIKAYGDILGGTKAALAHKELSASET